MLGTALLGAFGVRPVPDETAAEHLRNALALVRWTFRVAESTFSSVGEPCFVVPVRVLDALQRRLEAALERLSRPRENQ